MENAMTPAPDELAADGTIGGLSPSETVRRWQLQIAENAKMRQELAQEKAMHVVLAGKFEAAIEEQKRLNAELRRATEDARVLRAALEEVRLWVNEPRTAVLWGLQKTLATIDAALAQKEPGGE